MPTTSPNEPRTASLYHAPDVPDARAAPLDPNRAVAIMTIAFASYLAVAALAPRSIAVTAAQAALAVVPLAAIVIGRGRLAAIGLAGARLRYFAAAIAIGATTWYVNLRIVAALPLPEEPARRIAALIDGPSLAAALALFALVPAICEELLFRGVLARALANGLPLAAAAAISAVIFSAYHLSIVQALPTLTLGFLLAILTIRSGSIAPSITAHAINNAFAIAMSRDALPDLTRQLTNHPTLALLGCSAITGLGAALAAWPKRSPNVAAKPHLDTSGLRRSP